MDRGPEIRESTEAQSDAVHEKLRDYNRRFMDGGRDYNFHIEAEGEIVAGIVAASTGDTLEVEFLFVAESRRGQGLGRALLERAETAACRDGVQRVLLNTYSFQAPGFYPKMGYTLLGRIDPCFGAHSQYFYGKELD